MAKRPSAPTRAAVLLTANNCCAYPGCETPLDGLDAAEVVVEVAHIHSPSPDGPRPAPELSEDQLHAYGNLLAVCPTHHKVIDDYADNYPPEELRAWKQHQGEALEANQAHSADSELLHRLFEAVVPREPRDW